MHKEKAEMSKVRTLQLKGKGFEVIRIRHEYLARIFETDVMSKNPAFSLLKSLEAFPAESLNKRIRRNLPERQLVLCLQSFQSVFRSQGHCFRFGKLF